MKMEKEKERKSGHKVMLRIIQHTSVHLNIDTTLMVGDLTVFRHNAYTNYHYIVYQAILI